MNLPNKLTLSRVFMIPLFVVFMLLSTHGEPVLALRESMPKSFLVFRYLSFFLFAAASLTDLLDGKIARKRGLVTNFGKFADPLADKLLVSSALLLLSAEGAVPVWVVIIIIAREFIISGFRLIASDNGIVIAASIYGKWKTAVSMVTCLVLILPRLPVLLGKPVVTLLIVLMTGLTVLSLVDYIRKNLHILTEGGM